MADLAPGTARWLVSASGLDALARVTDELDRGLDEFAISARLRQDRAGLGVTNTPDTDGDDATTLIADRAASLVAAATARRRARRRWDRADQAVFAPEALEQASDPEVAAWRARRFSDLDVWDLCCGLGSDSIAMARTGARVVGVDVDAARLTLLAHNATIHGVEVATRHADALEVTLPAGAVLHADPSRRRDGRRARRLAQHRPAVGELLAVHRDVPGSAVVLSPAVDLNDPDLPVDAELEFVQVGDQLLEAVVWSGTLRHEGVTASATLLPDGLTRHRRGPRPPRQPVGPIGEWLVEMAPAAVRARLHDDLATDIDVHRVATNRALFTGDRAPPASPWWQARRVIAVVPARPKPLRAWLRTVDTPPVELVLHGVDGDPDSWWRSIGRPTRGPRGWRIELIRRDDDRVAVVTAAVGADPVADVRRGGGPAR